MSKVALALSGGGSRCIAQLGVISYLEDRGIEIEAISGSSGGAIVAGLYASGLSAREIYDILVGIDFKKYLKYSLRGSIYHLKDAISHFHDIFGKRDIADFDIPFFCTLTDYQDGRVIYKSSGDMVTLMIASSALVPIFAPVEYNGRVYIDGGFCDNLPSTPLKGISNSIIGINVNPMHYEIRDTFLGHIRRSMFIMLYTNVLSGKQKCDLFMEIDKIGTYSIFDLKNFELFFELGYSEAKKLDSSIERLV